MNWINEYKTQYQSKLTLNGKGGKKGVKDGLFNRGEGFGIIFDTLLKTKQNDFKIIETGTTRRPNNWKDGNSGYLFTEFVKSYGGTVYSVDKSKGACSKAKQAIPSDQYIVDCSDSVSWLKDRTDLNQIDFFYLDSYDVDWADDEPSATHHLNEFLAIEEYLKPGTIVAIDDNSYLRDTNTRSGKGRKIVEYLDNKGIKPVYDKYQIIYFF
jgi:hypothetical protein